MRHLVLAVALVFAFAGTAFAEGDCGFYVNPSVAEKSKAKVKVEAKAKEKAPAQQGKLLASAEK